MTLPAERDHQTHALDRKGRLQTRSGQAPDVTDQQIAPFGLQTISLDAERDALLYVPTSYQPDQPAPLAVLLHGAGGNAQHGIDLLVDLADAAGLLLLAPASYHQTWDVIVDDYGPDVEIIDQALAETFRFHRVDPARLALGGFSDGASYALSLGLTNGDLFSHLIAFSPGFMAPAAQRGRPSIYVSHGTQDEALPIEFCSRRIVPQLKQAGYTVRYEEFAGPHTVPDKIAKAAVKWLVHEGKSVKQ